jgi:Lrp/AsnC family transcriptional regulator, leucine-responsive regulatory protein
MPVRSSIRAIVRIRLSPRGDRVAFEWWLRAIPAVLSAVLVTGDVDYELQLDCRSLANLGDVLTRIRGYRGVEVDSTALVLHEVAGLRERDQMIPDEVTLRRLRNM